MPDSDHQHAEADRLESLWAGEFGDAYQARNADAGKVRQAFWASILERCQPRCVLEVGCNNGANLQWIAPAAGVEETFGIDINAAALDTLRRRVPGVTAIRASARELPFPDGRFDLTFTMGVLIHQPQDTLREVMEQIVRCSRRFVLCGEYFAEQPTEVHYRGIDGALFKRDYGGLYLKEFPNLRLVEQGFLDRDDGWDDVTWWLFEMASDRSSA